MKHIVVVGSGIAGLIAALEISRRHDVTLVTKARLADSNTRWAQGGIAAATAQDDSVAEHVADTLRAGAGLCERLPVDVLCTEGPERIRDLVDLGVVFDTRGGEFARGLEAAHSRPRVLHAGGDATGLSIELALVHRVRATANIRVREHIFACDLILRQGCVAGVEVSVGGTRRELITADAVVLASGGAGQLFAHTTNPEVATGDGVAMALRVGAQLSDVEFYQFHPTALAVPGTFLISEAVRGEGAVLLNARGERFMRVVHPLAELAPRDVVARGIAREMAAQGGAPVLLDATARGAEFLRARFPSIDAACRRFGFDWSREPIPVTPAAHYWMGGVRTDVWGRSSIPGLYAVGEVARTGVHGANRLASNSLLESLVFAWRCAALLTSEHSLAPDGSAWPEWGSESRSDSAAELVLDRRQESAAHGPVLERPELQRLMWKAAGIERNGPELKAASVKLNQWESSAARVSVEAMETANLLDLARVLVAAASARQESRGAHFRSDYPEPSVTFAHSQVLRQKPSRRLRGAPLPPAVAAC